MCNDNGGTMDDLIAFRVTEDTWRLVVNASRVEVDVEWIAGHLTGDARLVNLSDDLALLALQGPGSEAALSPHVEGDIRGMKHNDCLRVNVCGCASLLSRTGYTGEDGFEISFAAGDVTTVWDALAASAGVALCGLGARDVLRLEAGLCLYGHELSETITPLEAGLAWTVKWEKEDFIGRAVLWRAKETGIRRQLTGIRMLERGIPRAGCDVEVDGTLIGRVTSGTYSVTVGAGIALALVDIKWASPGHEVMINIRGEHKRGVTVKTPFVVSHAKHGKPAKQSKEEFA
jgi:aminomethyltransferase